MSTKYTMAQLENIAKEVARDVQVKQNTQFRKGQTQLKSFTQNMTFDRMLQTEAKTDERLMQFHKMCDTLHILDVFLSMNPTWKGNVRETKFYKESFLPFTLESDFNKAMTSTGVGTGNEWIPVEFSPRLIQRVQLMLRIASVFERKEMIAPTMELALKTLFSKSYLANEGALPAVEGQMGTGRIELKTKELVNWLPSTYTFTEDSIINAISEIEWDVTNAAYRAQENFTLNGSSVAFGAGGSLDNTNVEGLAFAAYDQEFTAGGLRDYTVRNDNPTTPLRMDISDATYGSNDVKISKLIASMKRYRGTDGDLFFVVSTTGEHIFRTLKTGSGYPLMQPIYSAGANATINGVAVNQIYGIPVIVSEFMRDDLNQYGVNDHTGGYGATNYSGIILCRRDAFTYGDKRKLMVETFRNIIYRKTDIVASMRVGLVHRYPLGDPYCVMGTGLLV